MVKNATRFLCKTCNNKLTTNQLRGSKGICSHCQTPMHHDNWRSPHETVVQKLDINKDDDAEICRLANQAGVSPDFLIRVAVVNALNVWIADPTGKALITSLLIEKLSRR